MKRVFLSALTLLSLCFSACAGALEVELYNALKKNDLKKCTELLKKGADIYADTLLLTRTSLFFLFLSG